MDIYKKAYAQLVGKVDNIITELDNDIPSLTVPGSFDASRVRRMLTKALLEAEEYVVDNMDSE